MRLFLAINPGENVQKKLHSLKEEIIIKSGKEITYSVKWEPENKLHLTLFFIGEIKNDIYNLLLQALSGITIPKDIIFRFSGITAFPNLRNPRVIVAGFKNDDGKADNLYKDVVKVMEEFNITAERGFKPHITLGRVKKPIKISNEVINEINTSANDYNFTSNGIELIQSKLTPHGSFYKVLKIFL